MSDETLREMSDIRPSEVSLVRRAANKKRFLIIKGANGMPDSQEASAPNSNLFANAKAFIRKSTMRKDAQKGDVAAMSDQLATVSSAVAKMLAPYVDQLPASFANDLADALGLNGIEAQSAAFEEAQADGENPSVELSDNDSTKPKALTDKENDVAKKSDAEDKIMKMISPSSDDVVKADDKEDVAKADDKEDVTKADDEEDIEKSDDEKDIFKSDDDEEVTKSEDEEDITKADDDGLSGPKSSDVSQADHNAALKKAQEAYDNHLLSEGYDQEGDSAVKKSASVMKGLSREQRRVLEPILKSHNRMVQAKREAVAKAARLEKKMQRERFIKKAAAFSHLGVAPEELGTQLHEAFLKDPSICESMVRVLKSADAQLRETHQSSNGMYHELGSRLSAQGKQKNPDVLIESSVDHIIKAAKAQGEKVSRAQIAKAYLQSDEGRAQYAKMVADRRANIKGGK